MNRLLKKFEDARPEVVFEWEDTRTDAKGWVVINSLRGGACAGGGQGSEQAGLVEVREGGAGGRQEGAPGHEEVRQKGKSAPTPFLRHFRLLISVELGDGTLAG